jgi:hypothetical protein
MSMTPQEFIEKYVNKTNYNGFNISSLNNDRLREDGVKLVQVHDDSDCYIYHAVTSDGSEFDVAQCQTQVGPSVSVLSVE